MSYFKWSIGADISLFLEIVKGNGVGLTGSDPCIMIRRFRSVDGNSFLDNYFWDGSTFGATAVSHSMTQVDATNQPGLYTYCFSQSLVQSGTVYNVHYIHNSDPVGFSTERHYFTTSGSSGDITLYESEPE